MKKYKFIIDPSLVPEIEIFLKKNPNLFPLPPEIKQNANISATVKFSTNNEVCLFKFHKFLLKIHKIESFFKKEEIKEPVISITLNWGNGGKAYFNYVLSSIFCQCLIENSIDFSIAKIKERYFHIWECASFWITKSDFKKVRKIIANSPLKNRVVVDTLIHIIADI